MGVTPNQPGIEELDIPAITAWIQKERCCPFCGCKRFIEGPCGGASQNMYCGNTDECGARFNDQGPFGWDVIQRTKIPAEDMFWKYGGTKKKAEKLPPVMSKNDILSEFGLAKKKRWYTPWRQA